MAFVEPFPDLLACELRHRIVIGASRSELMDMADSGKTSTNRRTEEGLRFLVEQDFTRAGALPSFTLAFPRVGQTSADVLPFQVGKSAGFARYFMSTAKEGPIWDTP